MLKKSRKMKIRYLPILFLFLAISCNSDPCEDLNCVNGNCVDGTCQCEEGFVGTLCDELPCVNGTSVNGNCNCDDGNYGILCEVSSVVGYYYITNFQIKDCPNYLKEYNLSANASEGRVCGTNHNDIGICFSNGISISEDMTMFWIRSTLLETASDKYETTFLEFEKGTYIAKNDLLTISLENGETRTVTISNNQLTWERQLSDGGSDNCTWKEVYTTRP